MRIVNTSATLRIITYRDGTQIVLQPAGGPVPNYVIRPNSDIDFLDDNAVQLSLFSSGVLALQNDDGSAYTGPALPSVPNPPPPGGTRVLTTDYTLSGSDDGFELRAAAALVLTVPSGLSVQPTVLVKCPASGNVTVRRGGTATLNGGTADLTRARSANPGGFAITPNNETDVYGVTGA